MWFGVVTLFPEMIQPMTQLGVIGRAAKQGLLSLGIWNPRDYAHDKHQTVDDRPYGGGPGMLMKIQPLRDAINAAKEAAGAVEGDDVKVIYMSPQGR